MSILRNENKSLFYPSCLPLVRWWWFSGNIDKEAVLHQLKWVKENNFGGVEIAFVYPLPGTLTGPEFLSNEWSRIVEYTKQKADELKLHCDFTFGTLWPFCGSFIPDEDSSKSWKGLSDQRVHQSWEMLHHPEPVKILDHLDKQALQRYSEKAGTALKDALKGKISAIFCDSWEVETEGLWCRNFDKIFFEKYGYDIIPYMADINKDDTEFINERYDYRKLIGELIINEFYKPFTGIAHELGSFSRVQCHGAPVDLLEAYSQIDVPESEAILFDPDFSAIPASAAALSGKTEVSCETFTCLYGWIPRPGPAPFIRQENVLDLKLLADALFANGINQVLWHGMPYSPPGGNNEFYATVHVGENGRLSKQFKSFNTYLKNVSELLKAGRPYSQGAVYLPLEDSRMAGMLPENLRKPSAFYHWEHHYTRIPGKLKGYRPLWISDYFLKKSKVKDNKLCTGRQEFNFLYIFSNYIDFETLLNIYSFAKQGLPVCIEKKFIEPGKNKNTRFEKLMNDLFNLENVASDLSKVYKTKPMVTGKDLPDFWCRKTGEDDYLLFFSCPEAKNLTYPMEYEKALKSRNEKRQLCFNISTVEMPYELCFRPNQSAILKITPYGIENMDELFFPEM